MFTTLTAEPQRVITRSPLPVHLAAWMSTPAVFDRRAETVQLAPGVWVIKARRWQPVSVLDVGALVPYPDVEPLRTVVLRLDWHELAFCRGAEGADDLFFGTEGPERPGLSPTATAKARSYCNACPVARECLTWALENDERYGIWGTTTGRQRAKLRGELAEGATVAGLVERILGSPAG